MARQRKKKARSVSGWIILDKPRGIGSTEAVSRVKRLFHADKAGHAGTLDPLASGVLPIALGEATKTVPYVMEGTKTYRFTIAWGEERSTDDLEGVIIKNSSVRPSPADIMALLPEYTGVIQQRPPRFSAIKIGGLRAYDLARDGRVVDIPSREVKISVLELVSMTPEGNTVFEVECGKGTYVRSLARDLGRDLGCYGHIADLRRKKVAPFGENDLVTLDALQEVCPFRSASSPDNVLSACHDFSDMDALLIETGDALECLPRYPVSDEQAGRIRSGDTIILRGQITPEETDEACVSYKNKVLAIGSIVKGAFQPRRVFSI